MRIGNRIIIVGCPGSGKSTLARKLCEVTGLPLVHLDNLWWNADGTHVSREVFDRKLAAVLSGDRWIVDGNFNRTLETRFRACDTVIFLDCDAATCLRGIAERVGRARSDIPWVEAQLDPEFEAYVHSFRRDSRPAICALLEKYPDRQTYVFQSRSEADRWLEAIDGANHPSGGST